jgi:hypothetical protein
MKSELAILRDEWLESTEGKQCCAIAALRVVTPLEAEKYLRNRIEAAFLAGAEANHKVQQVICEKLTGQIDV